MMTWAQIGLYVLCLNHSWNNNGLPADPSQICTLIRGRRSEFLQCWPGVEPCFPIADDGRRRNPRQEKERAKASSKQARTEAANTSRKRSRKRDENVDVYVSHARYDSDYDSVFEVSSEGVVGETAVVPHPAQSDTAFQEFIGVFLALGVALSEADVRRCCMLWISLEIPDRIVAYDDVLRKRVDAWARCEERYIPRPWNYLDGRQWTRIAVVKGRDRPVTKGEESQTEANRRFMESLGDR
jgi:uncharacterized protein YdaU (DUF1376 family)